MAWRRNSGLTQKQKKRIKQVATWAGIGLIGWETWQAMITRRQRRRDSYQAALNQGAKTNKHILVVGSPQNRLMSKLVGADHDCGDLCIDPNGCTECEDTLVADYIDGLTQLPDDSHVVYVDTGVFERSPQPQVLLNQLMRVSGGDLFMAPMGNWTVWAWLPPSKQRVTAAPPMAHRVEWKGWGTNSGQLGLSGVRLGGNTVFQVIRGGRG